MAHEVKKTSFSQILDIGMGETGCIQLVLVFFSRLFSFVELEWESGNRWAVTWDRTGGLVMMELASRHAGVNRLRFPFFSFGSRAFHIFFLDSPLLPVGLF